MSSDGADRSLAAVTWMLLSCAFLSIVSALARWAALEGIPILQIVFLRLAFALLVLLPLIWRRWPEITVTTRWPLYGWRIGIGLSAMICWFGALAVTPVGDVTAISFLTPIFSTLAAVIWLREAMTARRLVALGLGFAGTLIILRPGLIEVGLGMWLSIFAACAMAAASLCIKQLTRTDDPEKVVAISTMMQAPILLLPALLVWEWPTPLMWGVFFLIGLFASLGQVCLSRAFAAGDVGLVMSVDFARLPFAVGLGFILFAELIDVWTWIGAAVIFAGAMIAVQGATRHTRSTAR